MPAAGCCCESSHFKSFMLNLFIAQIIHLERKPVVSGEQVLHLEGEQAVHGDQLLFPMEFNKQS